MLIVSRSLLPNFAFCEKSWALCPGLSAGGWHDESGCDMCLHLKERSSAIARQEVSIHAIENREPCRVNALFLASVVAPITADGVASHFEKQSVMGWALKERAEMGWLIKCKKLYFRFFLLHEYRVRVLSKEFPPLNNCLCFLVFIGVKWLQLDFIRINYITK